MGGRPDRALSVTVVPLGVTRKGDAIPGDRRLKLRGVFLDATESLGCMRTAHARPDLSGQRKMRYVGIAANTPGSPDVLTATPGAEAPFDQPAQSPGCVPGTVERKVEAMRRRRFARVPRCAAENRMHR
jgi:hypothetical protein